MRSSIDLEFVIILVIVVACWLIALRARLGYRRPTSLDLFAGKQAAPPVAAPRTWPGSAAPATPSATLPSEIVAPQPVATAPPAVDETPRPRREAPGD